MQAQRQRRAPTNEESEGKPSFADRNKAVFLAKAAAKSALGAVSNETEILLKVRADAAEFKKLMEGFSELTKLSKETTAQFQTLGTALRSATNPGNFRQLSYSLEALRGNAARSTAELKGAVSGVNEIGAAFKRAAGVIGAFAALGVAKDAIVGFFKETTVAGVKFNAELEQARLGMAAVFVQAGYAKNFEDGMRRGEIAIDALRKKAALYGLDLESLIENYKTNSGSMFNAGVTSLQKQIDLTITLTSAAKSMGVTGFTAVRDVQDLLIGMSQRTKLGRELGMDDAAIKDAIKQGQLYEYLTEKLKGFSEAASRGAQTVKGLEANLHSAVMTTAAEQTKGLTDAYKDLLIALTDLVKSDGFKGFMGMLAKLSKDAVEAAQGIANAFSSEDRVRRGIRGLNEDVSNARTVGDLDAVNKQARVQLDLSKKMDRDRQEHAGPFRGKSEIAQFKDEQRQLQEIIEKTRPYSAQVPMILAANNQRLQTNAVADAGAESDAKHAAEVKHALTFMSEYVKESKKATEETERQIHLAEASAGNSATMTKALNDNEASVHRQYDLLRAKVPLEASEVARKEYLAKVNRDESEEMDKINKVRVTVTKKLNEEDFALAQEKARFGTLNEQIAAKEALIARIQLDTTKDEAVIKREIFATEQEIAELRGREAAKRMREASELQQRQRAAAITAVRNNPYLTDKQKDAQLNAAFRAEQGQLPGQIADASDFASKQKPGSALQTGALSEARRLSDRQAMIGNDISATNPTTNMQDLLQGIVKLQNGFKSIGQLASEGIGGAFTAINQNLTSAIMMTKTWGQAFLDIGQTILTSVVGALVQMSTQWISRKIAEFTVGKALAAASVSAAIPIAAALTAIWATPATLATIASFGGAAAEAPFAIEGAKTAVLLASLVPGKADGGIVTGPGGPRDDSVLTRLSAGEVVFSNRDIARHGGVAAVEAMRLGSGYSSSGAGVSASPSAGGAGGPAVGKGGGVVINQAYFNTRQDAEMWLSSQNGRRIMTDFIRGTQYEL